MKRQLPVVLVLAAVLLGGFPADAVPGPKGFASECVGQSAGVPVRREQAQGYLPPGFESSVGSASQKELPYLYVHSVVCGDPAAPELTMSFAYLLAHPPKRYAVREVGDRFILAAAIGGTEARTVERKVCLEDLFTDGDIEQVVHVGSPNTADGAFGNTVESDDLSASWDIVTTQISDSSAGGARWFFDAGKGVDFFDTIELGDALGLGWGQVRFTQPFLDLPPAGTGPAHFLHSEMYIPYRGCPRKPITS